MQIYDLNPKQISRPTAAKQICNKEKPCCHQEAAELLAASAAFASLVCYLAVSGGNGLGLVSAHVVVDTFLKLLPNQGAVLPAALRVRQALPFAQVIRVTSCRLLV